MRVTVLFFGMLKDFTGFANEQIELTEPASLDTVWGHYAARFPQLEPLKSHLRLARNREFSTLETPVAADDEIAFLPPVSGGTDHAHPPIVSITRDPIDARAVAREVQQNGDGAVVTFEGVVRDNTGGRATDFLEYEGYEAMALTVMEQLGREIAAKHAIDRIALVHRLGRLTIGEASVVIVVSAPHRKPAFAACLEAIDRLKATVPIWKKEHFSGGAVWVEGNWDDHALDR